MSKLAINGGSKVRNSSFPAWPFYDETEREALNRVLDSRNWWANQGTEVKAFFMQILLATPTYCPKFSMMVYPNF